MKTEKSLLQFECSQGRASLGFEAREYYFDSIAQFQVGSLISVDLNRGGCSQWLFVSTAFPYFLWKLVRSPLLAKILSSVPESIKLLSILT